MILIFPVGSSDTPLGMICGDGIRVILGVCAKLLFGRTVGQTKGRFGAFCIMNELRAVVNVPIFVSRLP